MTSSFVFLAVSVLLLGQVFCQDDFDEEYDERPPPPIVPDRRVPERDQTIESCLSKKMDIFFILDSSTSIYVLDYRRQLQFVRDVVTRLDVSPSSTRVGILTFSDIVDPNPIELNRYTNKGDLLASITEQNLPYRTGVTNTDLAIRYVRESASFRQTTDITKVIVVVTDGGSRSPGSTAREAELARDQGFYLFVIGVGQYLDENEWEAIATDPNSNFIYNITNFNFLDSVKFSLPQRACSLPPLIVGACRIRGNYGSLYYVATGRVQNFAYQLSSNFVERTTGSYSNIKVGYIFDNCNTANNVDFAKPELYCERDAFGENRPLLELLNRADSAATVDRDSRGDNTQVAVVFVDEDTLRFGGDQIRNKLQELSNDGLEVLIVDLSRRGVGAQLQNLLITRDNYIRFQYTTSGQEQVHRALIDRTCAAVTRYESIETDVN
ncbi:Matrilin-2 [Bulinus truncatus]|nr:Matrilin-2 [Bulinus truncatus]